MLPEISRHRAQLTHAKDPAMHTHTPTPKARFSLRGRLSLFLPPVQYHAHRIPSLTVHLPSPTRTHAVESVKTGGRVALFNGEGREEELVSRGMPSSKIVLDCADVHDGEATNRLFDSSLFSPLSVGTKVNKLFSALSRFHPLYYYPFTRPTAAFDRERTRSLKTTSATGGAHSAACAQLMLQW